jgi:mRNA-degrading endonuclease YafQ of YafQ-DinJ toxin-antitoxin module
MSKITKVVFTDLFWQTLEEHRKHSRYQDFRKVIASAIRHKADDRNYVTNSDKPMSGVMLKGVWHCKVSRTPDIIFFYRMTSDTIICAMIGSHHDYGFNGKNIAAGRTTNSRIEHSIQKGHQPSPNWSSVKCSCPAELMGNPDLYEASEAALDDILIELEAEADTLSLLARKHGALENIAEEVYGDWIERLDEAQKAVFNLQKEKLEQKRNKREYTAVDLAFTR